MERVFLGQSPKKPFSLGPSYTLLDVAKRLELGMHPQNPLYDPKRIYQKILGRKNYVPLDKAIASVGFLWNVVQWTKPRYLRIGRSCRIPTGMMIHSTDCFSVHHCGVGIIVKIQVLTVSGFGDGLRIRLLLFFGSIVCLTHMEGWEGLPTDKRYVGRLLIEMQIM